MRQSSPSRLSTCVECAVVGSRPRLWPRWPRSSLRARRCGPLSPPVPRSEHLEVVVATVPGTGWRRSRRRGPSLGPTEFQPPDAPQDSDLSHPCGPESFTAPHLTAGEGVRRGRQLLIHRQEARVHGQILRARRVTPATTGPCVAAAERGESLTVKLGPDSAERCPVP